MTAVNPAPVAPETPRAEGEGGVGGGGASGQGAGANGWGWRQADRRSELPARTVEMQTD